MTDVRNSNIELIRIIAMIMIVSGHILFHICQGELPGTMFYSAVTVLGVNLFVLISGYFNIRLSWKSILSLAGMVLFYQIVEIAVAHFVFDTPITLKIIVDALLPMSRKKGVYWFVSCYMMLMLLSPFINIILAKTTKQQYLLMLGILLYLSCFSGWIVNNEINYSGYSLFHLITIYAVGDAVNRFKLADKIRCRWWVVIYVLATVAIPFLTFYHPSKTLRYNNPMVIVASVSLFIILTNLKFYSKTVNTLATYMFPVYLLQEGYFGFEIYGSLRNLNKWGG